MQTGKALTLAFDNVLLDDTPALTYLEQAGQRLQSSSMRDVVIGSGETFTNVAMIGAPAVRIAKAGELGILGKAGAVETLITREGIVGALGEVVQPQLSNILRLDPDALVGFRGSLASGFKGAHKSGAPFDPTDFDIDGFIVSDKLAGQFSAKQWFRSGADIDEIAQAQGSIEASLSITVTVHKSVDYTTLDPRVDVGEMKP